MAEGHSILRWARRLRGLCGAPLRQVVLPERFGLLHTQLVGEQVTRIDTHGKHLLLRLSDGQTLHCHALMVGSWQFGAPGMPLRRQASEVKLRLTTARFEAVFFNGPVVELLDERGLACHPSLSRLGPDVLHEPFDREAAWQRLQANEQLPIGDAVLRQELVAGIGNIFKSEALFMARTDPRHRVADLGRERVERLWNAVIPIMRAAAAASGPIVTTPAHLRRRGERTWVYRRHRRPCLWCGDAIERLYQGPPKRQRSTYFCARCQR